MAGDQHDWVSYRRPDPATYSSAGGEYIGDPFEPRAHLLENENDEYVYTLCGYHFRVENTVRGSTNQRCAKCLRRAQRLVQQAQELLAFAQADPTPEWVRETVIVSIVRRRDAVTLTDAVTKLARQRKWRQFAVTEPTLSDVHLEEGS